MSRAKANPRSLANILLCNRPRRQSDGSLRVHRALRSSSVLKSIGERAGTNAASLSAGSRMTIRDEHSAGQQRFRSYSGVRLCGGSMPSDCVAVLGFTRHAIAVRFPFISARRKSGGHGEHGAAFPVSRAEANPRSMANILLRSRPSRQSDGSLRVHRALRSSSVLKTTGERAARTSRHSLPAPE